MGDSSKGICVGWANDRVYVRVVGRGTFQNSQPLRQFALEKLDQGLEELIVDLSRCQGMDSTFLGVLAGIGLRLRQNGRTVPVHVLNIGSRNMESLQTLGLDRLFTMNSSAPPPLPEADYHKLPDTDLTQLARPPSKDETADLMIEAHNNLVRADERNASRFKELTRFLRETVERRRNRGMEKK